MQVLAAILIFFATLFGMSSLIKRYDRHLMLYEHARRTRPCPRCGRNCIAVRRRATLDAPWGEWTSSCCGQPMPEEDRD